jgi:hypothetical protein
MTEVRQHGESTRSLSASERIKPLPYKMRDKDSVARMGYQPIKDGVLTIRLQNTRMKISHGLRKAFCRQAAEAGVTLHWIMAISAHKYLAEVTRYTSESHEPSERGDDSHCRLQMENLSKSFPIDSAASTPVWSPLSNSESQCYSPVVSSGGCLFGGLKEWVCAGNHTP